VFASSIQIFFLFYDGLNRHKGKKDFFWEGIVGSRESYGKLKGGQVNGEY
jgi:hypothetical protein